MPGRWRFCESDDSNDTCLRLQPPKWSLYQSQNKRIMQLLNVTSSNIIQFQAGGSKHADNMSGRFCKSAHTAFERAHVDPVLAWQCFLPGPCPDVLHQNVLLVGAVCIECVPWKWRMPMQQAVGGTLSERILEFSCGLSACWILWTCIFSSDWGDQCLNPFLLQCSLLCYPWAGGAGEKQSSGRGEGLPD